MTAAELPPMGRAEYRAAEKQAGYPSRKVLVLDFEGTGHDGLVVKAMAMSIRKMVELTQTGIVDKAGAIEADPTNPEHLELLTELFELFLQHLREWNLTEDDGTPTPHTVDAMLDSDMPLMMAIIGAWMKGTTVVSAPLVAASNGGATLPVPSMPMETLSPNPTS